jgi:hypothetical protein
MTGVEKSQQISFCIISLIIFILMGITTAAQKNEYEFNLDQFKQKALSLDGYIEFRPSLYWLNHTSSFYKLKYFDKYERNLLEEGYLALLADLTYRKGIFEAVLQPFFDYVVSPFESDTEISLFQGYLSFTPSTSLTIYTGKRTLRWGKGYAWSPVAVVERQKNPNEPDLAREGFWMITADYTKSYTGILKTLSLTPVIIPVSQSINQTFSKKTGFNFAGKIYFLFLDTDIDLVFLTGKSQPLRLGFDFSRNIRSNWEIHGEISLFQDLEQRVVLDNDNVHTEITDPVRFLLGIRYLSEAETTYILEYYHNSAGFDRDEINDFYSFVDFGYDRYLLSGDAGQIKEAAGLGTYQGFTPMSDYLFFRILQKDAFGVLYMTPAVTSIFNILDGSTSISPELTYKGITNFEFRLKAAILWGGEGKEFGEKPNRWRLELRARYYF